jgi:hypothetical protein
MKLVLSKVSSSNNLMRLCTKPKLLTEIGFGGEAIRAAAEEMS